MIERRDLIKLMQEFYDKKWPVIPDQIAETGYYTASPVFEEFLKLIMDNELSFIRTEGQQINTWFFDCLEINNLKYVTNLCKN